MSLQNEQVDEEVIKKIEAFIQRLRDLDYIIEDNRASLIHNSIKPLIYDYAKDDGQREEECLVDLLAKSITEYELSKNIPSNKISSIYKCEHWINVALTNGIVKEGRGLVNKLKDSYEKNTKLEGDLKLFSNQNIDLRKELEIISNDLMRAKQRIEELEQIMPSAGSEHS